MFSLLVNTIVSGYSDGESKVYGNYCTVFLQSPHTTGSEFSEGERKVIEIIVWRVHRWYIPSAKGIPMDRGKCKEISVYGFHRWYIPLASDGQRKII